MSTPTDAYPAAAASDVIDTAAGLAPSSALQTARSFRSTVVEATQASHEALLYEPVPGLSTADRLRVAVHCCEAAEAHQMAAHYRALLVQQPAGDASTPTLPAMLTWAGLLTTDPRRGDREALQALQAAGLADPAIVALAQLVAFLSYQTRVVAGLVAMEAALVSPAPPSPGSIDAGAPAPAPGGASAKSASSGAVPVIRLNGFTNETLGWLSWLSPLDMAQATDLQQAVLDESHPQARTSAYYLTLIHQPLMLRHRSAAYNAIMYAPGGAPRAERELAAMVVSVTNGCVYCTSVHAQRFAQLARRHDTVEQVFRNPATAGVDERERAIARFAQAVTLRPHTLAAADVAPLRQLGMSAEQILDVLHAAAIFGWANRLMHNLGEPEHPPAGA
ncbi:MAG: peroxidase-related enzyme [Rubrivivax sp.]|jgi:uncharacterized peroxidase-related enzyme|nr:peroxidase-related enzyme [Rubrivivax sp.]